MLRVIAHRKNSIASLKALQALDQPIGAEIDLRSDVNDDKSIHLAHDPWHKGESFYAWLDSFRALKKRGTLILNTKEDGLEQQAMQALKRAQIDDYFFLDTTLPTLVRLCDMGLGAHLCLRASAVEQEPFLLAGKNRPQPRRPGWIWLDCFGASFLGVPDVGRLAALAQICLVSCELQQGAQAVAEAFYRDHQAKISAVCTKEPERWFGPK